MKHTQGRQGRVFVLRFEHGDDFNLELEKFAVKKKIAAGFITFLGALHKGEMAAGPKKPVIPPQPNWLKFDGAWEVFGTGSLFTGKKGEKYVHLHTSMGKNKRTITGCLRKNVKVFMVIEALLVEVKGAKASKGIDAASGLNMLKIG